MFTTEVKIFVSFFSNQAMYFLSLEIWCPKKIQCLVVKYDYYLYVKYLYSAFQKDMQIDNKAIVSTVLVFNIQTINRNYRYTYM